jgi:hypothetical protein
LSFKKIFITGFFLALVGFFGLIYLFFYTRPTLGPRWLLYFLILIGLSGISLPVSAFLNWRFRGDQPVLPITVIREALMVGIFGDLLAWLQLGRVLNVSFILFIGIGFVAIEYLIRMREKSHWRVK